MLAEAGKATEKPSGEKVVTGVEDIRVEELGPHAIKLAPLSTENAQLAYVGVLPSVPARKSAPHTSDAKPVAEAQ